MNKIQRFIARIRIFNWKRNHPKKTEEFLFVLNSGFPTKVVYMGQTIYEGTGMQSFDFMVINNHIAPTAALISDKAKFNFSTLNEN